MAVTVSIFITAIKLPLAAGIISLVCVVGRIMYAVGYAGFGPKGRLVGAILWGVAILGSVVCAFVSIGKI